MSVFLGRGDGTFMQPVYFTVGSSPAAVAAKDLNGDGKVDLAIGNFGDKSVSVLMNQGSGAFGAAVAYNLGTAVETIAAGDVDGDGRLDLVFSGDSSLRGTASVGVLQNQGNGSFATPVYYAVGSTPDSFALTDLNGDGALDVAAANFVEGDVVLLLSCGHQRD